MLQEFIDAPEVGMTKLVSERCDVLITEIERLKDLSLPPYAFRIQLIADSMEKCSSEWKAIRPTCASTKD